MTPRTEREWYAALLKAQADLKEKGAAAKRALDVVLTLSDACAQQVQAQGRLGDTMRSAYDAAAQEHRAALDAWRGAMVDEGWTFRQWLRSVDTLGEAKHAGTDTPEDTRVP